MRTGRLRTLVTKELLDSSRNRMALLPVAIIAVLALALPFVDRHRGAGDDRPCAR